MSEEKTTYGFNLTDSARVKLKEIADKNGLTLSQTVERIIKKWNIEDELRRSISTVSVVSKTILNLRVPRHIPNPRLRSPLADQHRQEI